MHFKRLIAAITVLFVFIFLYETLVHGFLLTGIYSETPNIWRSEAEFSSLAPLNIAFMALFATWITFIFTRFYQSGGARSGLKFGFYIGILSGLQAAGAFYYLPISPLLAGLWFIINVIECVIAGVIIGAIYRI